MGAEGTRTTRERLVRAAETSLREEGFSRASARAIARRAGVNQALVFYHFASVNNLLLAALDRSSEERMGRYRRAVGGVSTVEELLSVAQRVYKEDIETGAMTVVSEMMAGSMAQPELKAAMIARMEPWADFVQQTLERVLHGSPLGTLLPLRTLAYALVAFYAGVNILTNLTDDRSQLDALFEAAARFAPVLGAIAAPPR